MHYWVLVCIQNRVFSMPALQEASTLRWKVAGRRPGRMYWVRPGRVFDSEQDVAFAGVHAMTQQVYFLPQKPALALFVQQPVTEEMVVQCTGADAIKSLTLAQSRIDYIRIVSMVDSKFVFHGVWMITKAVQQQETAFISMISMPDLL